MLSGAWADALAEDAKAVWETMIGVSKGLSTEEGTPRVVVQYSHVSEIQENG
jgi:hypothetical protein